MAKFLNYRPELIKYLIITLSFIFIFSFFSRSFDNDLGWHLRFGQNLWSTSSFPYADSYTYTYYNQKWVNHEWGGDWLFWGIYYYLGYIPLLLIITGILLAAFLIPYKIFKQKITVWMALISFLMIASVQHILVGRLAMFTPLFTVLLWYFLEKLPAQKNYYFWPITFWLWSVLHGSWILGFILIAIYFTGNLINLIFKKYYPKFYTPGLWQKKDFVQAGLWTAISAVAICFNPYGLSIWNEVLTYFTSSFYKMNITEWLPSNSYPIYWKPLLVGAVALPLAIIGFWKKKITTPQLLLFLAFSYSAFSYKRNAIFIPLIVGPLFNGIILEIKNIWVGLPQKNKWLTEKIFYPWILIATIFCLIFYSSNISLKKDIWNNNKNLTTSYLPAGAVQFLKTVTAGQPVKLFNEFNWGGYLNWMLPNALIYLDGRGTVSWLTADKQKSLLQEYVEINREPGGLEKIEAGPAEYILLSTATIKPGFDWVNRLFFSPAERAAYTKLCLEPRPLITDLESSQNWEKIYSDELSAVWKRKSPAQK